MVPPILVSKTLRVVRPVSRPKDDGSDPVSSSPTSDEIVMSATTLSTQVTPSQLDLEPSQTVGVELGRPLAEHFQP